ncbi:magnesium transporter CorA family protein [Pseudohalioglobus lutimaris]|uniref:Metal transporter n=1 Tax=Pseudohalioglobus lutimaris TaxID=1737061 RepID=A0A2N5X4A9_9GAMM|nr:magnesium transporter CorA family protein [Pseudohalioglobus lutimaris]PLW69324.1 metal transporter [Pseudohalioglobus lutimaris]
MIRTMLLASDGNYTCGGVEQVESWRASEKACIWLDIEAAPSEDIRSLLQEMDCNPLAINDALRLRHPPKIEAFDNNTFLLYRGLSSVDGTLDIAHQQIGMWAGQRYLITYHRENSISVSHMWENEASSGQLHSPGVLAMKILHYACSRYLETMLDFEQRLADLEDGLVSDHSEEEMKELVSYRSKLRKLRRVFSYHNNIAELLYKLPDQYFPFLGEQHQHVRRDVYDRCERLHSLCQMYYEICADLVEGHISLASHKLNQTMKVLTIISALFVPLTFIAGIYGMNFEYMPELGFKYAYFGVVGFMATLAVALLILFRRIKWL